MIPVIKKMQENSNNQDQTLPRPHVAFICSPQCLYRYGRTIRTVIIGLLDEPMKVSVVCQGEQDTSLLPSPPVRIFTAPPRVWPFFSDIAINSIAENLLRSGVNILHGLDLASHGLLRKLSEITNLPYILSVHRTDHQGKIKPIGQNCYALLVENIPLRDKLLGENLIADHRVCLLKTGIYPQKTLSSFSHDNCSKAIIIAGEINDVDSYEPVLLALTEIAESERDCNFFIVGAGKDEFKLRKIARKLSLNDKLTFNSSVNSSQISHIFRFGDIIIYPDAAQTLETTIMEAMSAGTAILAANAASSDILLDGQTAIFYPQNNSADLTEKLTNLLDNPEKARQLASDAQNYLKENHSPSEMVSELAKYYQNCLLGVN